MIAFFPGKFQPPHLGHIITIMDLYDKYDKIIIAITDDVPRVSSSTERKSIFERVFRHLEKVEVVLIPGVLTKYKTTTDLPHFDVCLSGNEDVIDRMKRLGKKVTKVPRSVGIGYSGREIRKLIIKD